MIMGIYKITCLENNKVYIGQSKNTTKRLLEHRRLLKSDNHYNKHLQKSWNKYGEDNFTFEIIVEVFLKSDLDKLEQFYIDKYKSLDNIYGYNKREAGYSGKHIEEIKSKMSKTRTGKSLSDITKDRIAKTKYKKVIKYDKDSKIIIEEYNSVLEASGNNLSKSKSIAQCCRGIIQTSYGFVWKYKEQSG